MSLKLLRDRKAKIVKEMKDLGAIDAEKGLDDTQAARYAALEKELEAVNASIERAERLADTERTMGAAETVDDAAEAAAPATPARASVPAEPVSAMARIRWALPARHSLFMGTVAASLVGSGMAAAAPPPKFATFGDQLMAVAAAGMNKGGKRDERLIWGAASGANEAVPSEGGFVVETVYSTALLEMMHELGDLLARVRRVPLTVGNGVKLPMVDETSRVDGSRWGGVQAYWADEADSVTGSKPKFRQLDLDLKKLMGLGYATEELLRDAALLEAIMSTAFAEELTFKAENAIINGTGSGQPLGILNSGAVITINPESGQAAASVVTANILNMWSRLPRRCRRNAVWTINQDVEPQLYGLTLGTGTAVVLLYTPPGVNGNNSPYGLLLGRPVIPLEYNATLGTAGDIMLIDPSQYIMIDKDGIQQASSMHVRFIYDEMTFRFIYRVDGQPTWNKPVTPFKGTNTQSPFLALGTRA